MVKEKMYAHIYFNIPEDSLGIAVYAFGKIPGFSGNLDEALSDMTGSQKAYELFLKTLGKGKISKEELQQGRIFQYNQFQDQIKTLNLLGKLIVEDKEAQVVVDLDNLSTWWDLKTKNLSREEVYALNQLSDRQKKSLSEQFREEGMTNILSQSETSEDVGDAIRKIYISLSRQINPTSGPKDFPGSKKYKAPTPPTFLVSKEYDFAYYPGFKGAHYMTKTPDSDRYIYPHSKGTPSQEKWRTIIIPNASEYSGQSLSNIKIEELDYITETLARLFFNNLSNTSLMDFNKAVSTLEAKAKTMLTRFRKVELQDMSRSAGGAETWIDLESGKIYNSEQDLISSLSQSEPEQEERLPLAAQVRLAKLSQNFKVRSSTYSKVIKVIKRWS